MQLFERSNVYLASAGIMFYLYFTLPDIDNYGGFVTSRILLLAFVFIIIWINWQNSYLQLALVLMPLTFLAIFLLANSRNRWREGIDASAREIVSLSGKIKPYSTVVPFNFDDEWLSGHLSNYLGIEQPIIILENYEARTGQFPLQWNYKAMPNIKVGEMSSLTGGSGNYCWATCHTGRVQQADYVFILGQKYGNDGDSLQKLLAFNLSKYYVQIERTPNSTLYICRSMWKKNQ